MTDEQLLARQDALQDEARRFADEHRLDERLGRLGRVIPVGSAVTGLMVWRDLDYTVDAPGVEAAAVWDALAPVLHRCRALKYADETRDPVGRHYFVLRVDGWKLDVSVWTNGAPEDVERYQRELPARLDRRTRLTILRLKDVWHVRPEYPEIVGGYDICRAVLDHGVATPAELASHLAATGSSSGS